MTASVIVAASIVSTRLLARTGPRPLIPTGMVSAAAGMALLTRIGVDTGYASHVLPSLVLIGLGFGMIIASAIQTATLGVARQDSGVASAMVSTSQQVGGSVGTALLSTLAASAASAYVTDHGAAPAVLGHAAVAGLHHRVLVGGGDLRRRRGGHRGPPALRGAPRGRARRARAGRGGGVA